MPPCLSDFLDNFRKCGSVSRRENYLRAVARDAHGDGAPDATAGPGHNDYFAGQGSILLIAHLRVTPEVFLQQRRVIKTSPAQANV